MKTPTQILYDKGIFDNDNNADEVLKDFSFIRKQLGSKEVFDNEIQ